MSLLLWLPLNGDTRNQGLTNATVGNTGATVSNSGKTGSCYVFNGTSSYFQVNGLDIDSKPCLSICFWVVSNSGDLYGSFIIRKSGTHQLTLNTTGLNFRDSKHSSLTSISFTQPTTGVWTHYAIVYDNGSWIIYKDGTEVKRQTYAAATLNSGLNEIRIGRAESSSENKYFNGRLNDFRIYDHALSQKEVKELSKGLILHYKLDDEYIEKTTNLGGTSVNYSNQTYGNAYNASSWGGDKGTVTFYPNGGYNNYPYKVYHKTSGGTGGIYRKTANDITIESGKTYTMSVYVKSDRDFTDSAHSFNINGSSVTNSNHYITAPSNVHFTTEWTRVVRTFTATSAMTGKYGEMSILYNDAVEDYYVYYSGFQIEENDHATPYANGTNIPVCIDCSGYRNDGIPGGKLASSNDSPKYLKSTTFSGNGYIAAGTNAKVKDEITVACWAYMSNWSSFNGRLLSCTESGGWNFEPSSGKMNFAMGTGVSSNTYKSALSTTTLANLGSGWHHFAGTYDGFNTKIYIDGVLETTTAAYTTKTPIYYHASNGIFVGAEAASSPTTPTGSYFNGKLSDVRIYATALSAEDIKELYNLGASIDNNGNIYTGELIEV